MGPARRAFLRREVADAAELLDRRELTKRALLRVSGAVRRVEWELGGRLESMGALERTEDVWLLADRELQRGPDHLPTIDIIARRRHRLDSARLAGPLPRLFVGRPSAQIDLTTGSSHQGWGASPGRYEGRARIVRTVETGSLSRGEVLVARATDASWAPLFLLAGAIVVEDGGPLSHAAVLARELGVPAVINLPGIVDEIDRAGAGVRLLVDGTEGSVAFPRAASAVPEVLAVDVAPTRLPPDDAAVVNRTNVFVTGLIGAGALLSAVAALTETLGSPRSGRRLERRAQAPASNLAIGTVRGFGAVLASPTGLWSRRGLAAVAFGLAATGAAAAAAGAGAYFDADTDSWSVLMLGLGASGCVALLGGSGLGAWAAWRWPAVPPVVRQVCQRHPARPALTAIPARYRWTLLASLAVVATLLVLASTAESWLLAVDERIYDGIDAGGDAERLGPEWFNYFGRPEVVIPLAVAIAVLTARCRVLALAFPLAIVVGGLINVTLQTSVARVRPTGGGHAGEPTSFPSGHAVALTLLLGILPLAVAVLVRRRELQHAARIVSTFVLAVVLADGVRAGSHWPSDHLAGFAIGVALVTTVHWLVATPDRHRHCRHSRDRGVPA